MSTTKSINVTVNLNQSPLSASDTLGLFVFYRIWNTRKQTRGE